MVDCEIDSDSDSELGDGGDRGGDVLGAMGICDGVEGGEITGDIDGENVLDDDGDLGGETVGDVCISDGEDGGELYVAVSVGDDVEKSAVFGRSGSVNVLFGDPGDTGGCVCGLCRDWGCGCVSGIYVDCGLGIERGSDRECVFGMISGCGRVIVVFCDDCFDGGVDSGIVDTTFSFTFTFSLSFTFAFGLWCVSVC